MESSHFLAVISPCGNLQNVVLRFLIYAPTPKIYSPKFAIAQNRLEVGSYDRYTADVWAYQAVFGDGRFNGTMYNVVGPIRVAMATKFGQIIAYT